VDLQGAPLAALSGGQRARLAMLVLRLTAPSLYLLDEPTNHLDIEGQEALEAELRAPGATALLMSHDRAFVRAVGTRFWQVDGGRSGRWTARRISSPRWARLAAQEVDEHAEGGRGEEDPEERTQRPHGMACAMRAPTVAK
jgi:ATPase subunit of ABC transporter with duplicated ATPase domains